MKDFRRIAITLLLAAPLWGAGRRVAPQARPFHPLPLPIEAQKKGVQGNVVIVGDISAAGNTANLRVVKSSSPLLTQTALAEVRSWTFSPATEDGKPLAISLNAVVRFRTGASDPGAKRGPVEFDAPILGNITATPSDAAGRAAGPDGFPVEKGDGGISGVVVVDLPRSAASRPHRVAVSDRLPGGRIVRVLEATASPSAKDPDVLEVSYHRAVRPLEAAERGLHSLLVTVDGRDAGAGVYRVGR